MYSFLCPSVTLSLVNGQACSGDNLTFSCEATETAVLVWRISALPGFAGSSLTFGQTLNDEVHRITSPDTSQGPNPSSIIIQNVTATDNGATVQCGILNGAFSEEFTISIRE